jgi:transglutaminase-like putative cysteine protease
MQKVEIQHQTQYRFDRPVSIMPHVVRLRPAPHCRAPIHHYELTINPSNHTINWQQDPFSNYLARLFFPDQASELILNVDIVADIIDINPFDFFLEESAETFPFKYDRTLQAGLSPFLTIKEHGPLLMTWLENIDQSSQPTIDFLVEVNKQLYLGLDYHTRYEAGVQNCEQTLSKHIGSCRDSAWLLIQILRHMGLAARFVSGYAIKLEEEQDSIDLHAWAEVYIPGAGWIGLDPTSGLFAAGSYIPLACTPEPETAAPVTGNTAPCAVDFSYSSKVTRIK